MNIVIFLCLLPLFASVPSLAGVSPGISAEIPVDSCDFYDHLDAKFNCGENGYFQQFASPYCRAYLEKKEDFSPKGQMILRNIRLCLQEVLLVVSDGMTCSELENYGIDSHEYCYLKSGYCDLGNSDQMRIFWIARSEIFNLQIWQMVARVHSTCGQRHF